MPSSSAVDDVGQAGTDELVARYAAAARRHGQATVTGTHTANADAVEIAAIYRELRSRRKQSALLPLLDVDEPGVQAWAGAHALEFAPEEGEPVLARLAEGDDLMAFDAKITLREWQAGRLRFP